jgi:uncharacterized protein YfdQ (DUF2303 family)
VAAARLVNDMGTYRQDFSAFETEAAVVAELAKHAEIIEHDDEKLHPIAIVPPGHQLQSVEDFAKAPYRRRGKVTLHDAESFIAFVNRFEDDHSLVFADSKKVAFRAVLNYHESGPEGNPRHSDWQAIFTLRLTEDWTRWIGMNKRAVSQVEFAQFLEDNLLNIAEPAGTDILSLATHLQVHKDVAFRSNVRLQDGMTQFLYEESDATRGEMRLPPMMILGIIPFDGSPSYRVEARLRYRVNEGRLTLWYDLVRPDRVVDTAFADVEKEIREGLPETVILHGEPNGA